jgi:hypothetical protein
MAIIEERLDKKKIIELPPGRRKLMSQLANL